MVVRKGAWPSEFDAETTTLTAGTTTDLSDFLKRIDLLHLHDHLQAEDIDMTVLPLVDDNDLKELGLSLGQRKRLLKGLKELGTSSPDTDALTELSGSNPVQLRRLSVLFCDMVGSTELGERLNIDEMQIVLQKYYDIASTIAQRHNGHLAASQGDGLVILFGYPRVLDGFAERSILAAKDLQETLSETPLVIEGHDPIYIATRIGIASGQAAVGLKHNEMSGDHIHLVGPVVNRAARLQTVAHPQSCAVDFRTRELSDRSVHYSEAEQHRLKGLSDPVEVFHVLGLRQAAEAYEAPATLVGRDAETATLSNLWAEAQKGHAVMLTISGDAGMGKSTFVNGFLAAHVTPRTRVIHMLCTAMASRSPLRPVANALTALTKAGDGQQSLDRILNHPTPEMTRLAAQFLEIADTPNGDPAISSGDRQAILDLLTGWLVNRSEGPTVVVLENAQWADDSTCQLMVRTADRARSEGAPLLMIAVTRDDSKEMWSDSNNSATLVLSPLNRSVVEDLLNRILKDTPVPYSVRENILYHADGNPLMLETLAHAQIQHDLPEFSDAVLVPHTIYESVSKRLDSIRSGRAVIEALAVLSTPASRDLLHEVVPSGIRDMTAALKALEQAGLIERLVISGREHINIRHKTYRDVIYEQIDGQSRRQIHLAAYRALCDLADIRPEVLASHAQAAKDWENASIHALDAAEAFLKRSALIEAGHFFEIADAALNVLPASLSINQKRLRATTGLASVERSRFGIATDKSGKLGEQAVALAENIGDEKAKLLALNGLYSYALVRANYPKAEENAKALLASAEKTQNQTFIMIGKRAIGAVALHTGDQKTAVQHLSDSLGRYDREAHLSLAHAHGYDPAEVCAALLSMSLWISGDLQRARHFSAFSINHSRDIDHAHSLAQAISFRVMLGALARHGAELTEIGAEGVRVAEKYGIRVMRAASRLFPFATELCLRPENPTLAEMADLEQRVEEFRAANPYNYGPLLAVVLAEVYLKAGDVSSAEAVLSDAQKTVSTTGETWTSSEVVRMQANVAAARGNHAAASRLRTEALELARQTEAVTIALRIACDMAEAGRCPATFQAVRDALSQMASRDQEWDIRRAEAILQSERVS